MKKQLLALSMVLAMFLSVTAQAIGPAKAPEVRPILLFSGTTATCTVTARGKTPTDAVRATTKLWNGRTCLNTWTASGTGSLRMSKTATVSRGKTYTLTVDYTINGIKQPQRSVTKTCP